MATQNEYRRGANRLLDFIAAEYNETGISLSGSNNAQFYYKLPAVFAYGGRRGFAVRALQQFQQKFLEGQNLNLDPFAAQWKAYIAGWVSWGAGVLGRFDLAREIISTVLDTQNAHYGGFSCETEKGMVLDVQRTSGAAMGCVWSGALENAARSAKFIKYAIDNQSEPGVFYTYFNHEGKVVPGKDNRMAYFSSDDQHAFPAMFGTTVACLVWLGRALGNLTHFETAYRFMKIVFSSRYDPGKMPLATKLGWAALMLSTHIKDDSMADFARRNGDDLLRRQNDDGSIDFDEVPGIEKPIAKVWQIGWGCDAALTLIALGDGVS